ncbi:30S ribosomal protein S4 [Candidatus Woesearchaeota archaeon]|nr:30S ribosomal protein S4 [Candidatus Woesearchaeota archaeon]
MGDTRRFDKSFARPFKPWDDTRIDEEKKLLKDYGLKNKREIWKAESLLRRFKAQAKKLIATRGKQAELEKQQLLTRLKSLGLTTETADLDTVLGLTIKNVLDRRLQTVVHNRKLARSIGQARQFIVHEHINVSGKKIGVPSYLVRKEEEEAVTFSPESAIASEMHPERAQKKPETPTDTVATDSKEDKEKAGTEVKA